MSRDIELLHPKIAELCRATIIGASFDGIRITVTQTRRTFEEQNELYAQGRTKPGPVCLHTGIARPVGSCPDHPFGLRVTNARGGESFHNYDFAFDFAVLASGQDPKPTWDRKIDVNEDDEPDYEQVGAIGEQLGLEWGGRWKREDLPHFQKTFGLTIADLRAGKKPSEST